MILQDSLRDLIHRRGYRVNYGPLDQRIGGIINLYPREDVIRDSWLSGVRIMSRQPSRHEGWREYVPYTGTPG
jgi:hypothetical protein